MTAPARRLDLAVMGAGIIGRRHAEIIAAEPRARLAAIVDPAPLAEEFAKSLGAPWFATFEDMVARGHPDGIVVATPNQLHVAHGLACIASGIPALIEKPLADSAEAGEALVAAAEKAGVPLLTGHHRRHNPLVAKAREIIRSGRLGRVLTVNGMFWLAKPEDYFDVGWRRKPGAGPVYLNMIHDIDLLRHLVGEIVSVQAQDSNALRGYEVEESAVILLRFANGALGTISACDAVAAPWSWELTSGENPVYPRQPETCLQIGGTQASLTLPDLEVWSHRGKPSWWEPLQRERTPFLPGDPYQAQIRQFCDVIRDGAAPLVSGREGLKTLRVVEAVKKAAASGETVRLAP